MSTLLELTTEIRNLEIALTEIDDEEMQAQLMVEYLQTTEDLKTKLENYANLISELEARAEFRKQESKRIAERASVDSNLAKRLKERLLWYMKENELKKVETLTHTISRSKNGGKNPLVIDENISPLTLPKQFQRVSVEPNKEAIREALENGEELEFARLAERSEGVKIK